MIIQQLKNHEIDKQKWDETISLAPNGIAYAYSWYLDAVFPNWEALVIEDYQYIFPLTIKKKYIISYFFTPVFAMQLGVFSKNEITEEIQVLCYDYLRKINMFDISVNPSNQFIPDGFTMIEKECQIVYLNQTYEAISNEYSTNLKRNLKKANKYNLTLKNSTNIKNVVFLFKKNRGDLIKDFKDFHYEVLENLISEGLERNKIFIVECFDDREVIAAGFFSITNNRIIYHKGGSNEKGKKYGAMPLIIDTILKKYQNSNYIFDFGGSSIESVKKFNNNFTKINYSYYTLIKTNKLFYYVRTINNSLKEIFK